VLLFSLISAFYSELPFIYFPNFLDGIRVLWSFVVPDADYSGEPQGFIMDFFNCLFLRKGNKKEYVKERRD
jgi:hypothetical protein